MQSCLIPAVLCVHVCSVLKQDPHNLMVTLTCSCYQRRHDVISSVTFFLAFVAGRAGGLHQIQTQSLARTHGRLSVGTITRHPRIPQGVAQGEKSCPTDSHHQQILGPQVFYMKNSTMVPTLT